MMINYYNKLIDYNLVITLKKLLFIKNYMGISKKENRNNEKEQV